MLTDTRTYTLRDLQDGMPLVKNPLAVVGFPVEHSLSPRMHNAALQHMAAEDARWEDWRYYKFSVAPEELAEALPCFWEYGFQGLNLTVPHKVMALSLLEQVDEMSQVMGAVNTLCRGREGFVGYNTDGYGLRVAVEESLAYTIADADVVLLGAGGAARAAAVECLQAGCRCLHVGNRSRASLQELVGLLEARFGADRVRSFLFAEAYAWPESALFIQATSSGLQESDACPVAFSGLGEGAALFDMIYQPPQTVSMQAATAAGVRTANGLAMLLFQGVRALELWTEQSVPVEVMRKALQG